MFLCAWPISQAIWFLRSCPLQKPLYETLVFFLWHAWRVLFSQFICWSSSDRRAAQGKVIREARQRLRRVLSRKGTKFRFWKARPERYLRVVNDTSYYSECFRDDTTWWWYSRESSLHTCSVPDPCMGNGVPVAHTETLHTFGLVIIPSFCTFERAWWAARGFVNFGGWSLDDPKCQDFSSATA